MKISTLKQWVGKEWSAGYFSACLESIKTCCPALIFEPIKIFNAQNNTTPLSAASNNVFFSGIMIPDVPDENNAEIQLENFKHRVYLEVEKYRALLSENNFNITLAHLALSLSDILVFVALSKTKERLILPLIYS